MHMSTNWLPDYPIGWEITFAVFKCCSWECPRKERNTRSRPWSFSAIPLLTAGVCAQRTPELPFRLPIVTRHIPSEKVEI